MAMSAERKAERKVERAYEKRMNALKSIAHKVMHVSGTEEIVEVGVEGCILTGNVAAVNVALEKMGYRPVRLTSNMLNPNSKTFAVDINTPAYCDPGCESYHSM